MEPSDWLSEGNWKMLELETGIFEGSCTGTVVCIDSNIATYMYVGQVAESG